MNQLTNSISSKSGTDKSNKREDRGEDQDKATIGSSIKIKGDVSGKEDLIINGSVEGTIDFRDNDVVVGEKGQVNANVIAKNISVEGELKGELRGSEQVTIKPSGRVVGDIRAPRVVLNDGCQFKGSVDMEEKSVSGPEPRSAATKLAGSKPFPGRPTPPDSAPPKL